MMRIHIPSLALEVTWPAFILIIAGLNLWFSNHEVLDLNYGSRHSLQHSHRTFIVHVVKVIPYYNRPVALKRKYAWNV